MSGPVIWPLAWATPKSKGWVMSPVAITWVGPAWMSAVNWVGAVRIDVDQRPAEDDWAVKTASFEHALAGEGEAGLGRSR